MEGLTVDYVLAKSLSSCSVKSGSQADIDQPPSIWKGVGVIIKEMRLLRVVTLLVVAAIIVVPVGMALAQQINPVRALPATVERGGKFNVTVTFTAVDNFTGPSLSDSAPASWNVTVNGAWCQPSASPSAKGSVAEVLWIGGPYANGTNFSVLYQVTVPCNASGSYNFTGDLYYYIWPNTTPDDEIHKSIAGDSQVQVVGPAICSPPSITFYASLGQNPENQTLQIWSSTPCMLNWTLSDDADWLSENRTSGNCTDVASPVALSVNSSGMSLGNYTANITIQSPEANNSPRIVPVTLHITESSILNGHVSFYRAAGPGDSTWQTPLVVRFFDNSTKHEPGWSPINASTDAYGNFTIEGLPTGTYDIGVKNYTTLSKMAYGKNFTAGNITAVDFGLLTESDTDNDDQIKGADFNRVLVNFGAVSGDLNWNALYDFDRSFKIDGADFNLVLTKFNLKGDLYYY